MDNSLKYKRVLLKVSGEALLGDQEFGIDQKPVEMIAKDAKGFIYLVSSMGVTGTREDTSFANNLEEIINHIHQVTDTPVAIGFGINKPEQVKEFKQYADGVIVGSAIVNIIKEHGAKADEPLKEYIQLLTNEL